jgi:anti-sigma B factor antagonist
MMEHDKLEVHSNARGDVIVVEARGRATLGENSDLLDRELQRLALAGWKKMLVDLRGVVQVDSSGISALVRQCTGLARQGGSLRLVCPPGRVYEALSVTRLLDAIPTFDNEADALASFRQAVAKSN